MMVICMALSPHPPLIVPGIGAGRDLKQVEETIKGMRSMAADVAACQPDTLIFITPHGNVYQDAISMLRAAELEGDFGNFGRSDLGSKHPNDVELLAKIAHSAARANLPAVLVDRQPDNRRLNPRLDHGILVPLHYLDEAGLSQVPVIAISIGYLPLDELYRFGMVMAEAAEGLGRRAAVIASGDMSHRLKDEGPYSFHPDGPVFEERIGELLSASDVFGVLEMDETLRENAGECGFRSIVMMLGAMNGRQIAATLYAHEGPFGVGYLTMGFVPGEAAEIDVYARMEQHRRAAMEKARTGESEPVRWARETLEEYVKNGRRKPMPQKTSGLLEQQAGAFVSIKKDGQLRGCIGTIQAVRPNLAAEIQENAISAGTEDPRFMPIGADELERLVYSVDIMGKPEAIKGMDELDPARYGVIVRSQGRSGLLLPDLEGVDTAEEQVRIACQKAGIRTGEHFSLERFEVTRYK